MSQQLEEEFKKRERERHKTERLKQSVITGEPLPGSLQDTLQKVTETKALLSDLIEAGEFQRVVKSLDMATSIHTVEQNLSDVIRQFTDVKDMLDAVNQGLSMVAQALTADLVERGKLRAKQMDTLGKIDDYLSKWS